MAKDSEDWIIFNGINLLDIPGMYVQTDGLPPPPSADARVDKQQIPGRSGDLRIVQSDLNGELVYDPIELDTHLAYIGKDYGRIKSWLKGTSNLILSNQLGRYYRASVDNKIPFEYLMEAVHQFTVTFSCFPYAFLTSGDVPLEWAPTSTNWKTIIMNNYNLSLPHLVVYGQGDIGIMVNGVETDFYSVDQYIECDSELQQCYKGIQNLGMNMSGEFPALYSGKNIIEFTGNIQKVILTPRWRSL